MWTIRSTASARPAAPADIDGRVRRLVRTRDETGAGLVDTFVGFTIFLVALLFGAQMLVHLYVTSTLTSTATRAAEAVAQSGDPPAAVQQAEESARQQLGSFGAEHTRFIWEEADSQQVVLRVVGESPGFLPLPASWRDISRTVTIRTERFR